MNKLYCLAHITQGWSKAIVSCRNYQMFDAMCMIERCWNQSLIWLIQCNYSTNTKFL
uniref:Uncharacterized protein n=1 Tax=Rhizophora mucronata TaxID=61149 RepID=A0A2P2MEA0_RHIMU